MLHAHPETHAVIPTETTRAWLLPVLLVASHEIDWSRGMS